VVTLGMFAQLPGVLATDDANGQRVSEDEWRIERLVRGAFKGDAIGGSAGLTFAHPALS
jgi:hypothetical protein